MRYKSYKGKMVDMEEMRRQHDKTIAAGNAGMNAAGDKLGAGGKVVETAQRRAMKHYNTTKTAKTTMSIKGDQDDAKKELFAEEKAKNSVEQTTAMPTGNNTPTGRKKAPRKKTKRVETETPAGDIIVEDVEVDDED